ncbi:MAG TPA: cytochrome P450 [Acidobacteriota bacterium]|nr:cytochrome P450 [Acidobacteriota bacterium]
MDFDRLVQDERAILDDPYPSYEKLRRRAAVHRSAMFGGSWVVPRYQDVYLLLREPRLSAVRSDALVAQLPQEDQERAQEFASLFSRWMWFFDGKDHQRIRRALSPFFGRDAVSKLRGFIQAAVDELLLRTDNSDDWDFITDFARPLPALVIARMLGVPPDDRDRLVGWSDDIADFFGNVFGTPEMAYRAQDGIIELSRYFTDFVARKRRHRDDGLVSSLAHEKEEGLAMSDEEIVSQCAMLMFAGHETTRNLLGNGMVTFLQRPHAIEQFLDPGTEPRAVVDELLRFDSPVQIASRVVGKQFECHGHRFAVGELVLFLLGSANRDPAEFNEPDKLILDRKPNRHVSFGSGPRFCLGAQLAHLEAEIAFKTIFRRMPDLRANLAAAKRANNFGFRGFASLPVVRRTKARMAG